MTSRKSVSRAASAAIAVCAAASFASAGDVPASSGTLGDLRKVGTVQLKSSCGPAAQAELRARGVALLHSFFYEEARRVFAEVAAKDAELRDRALGRGDDLLAPDLDAAQRRGAARRAARRSRKREAGSAARPRSSAASSRRSTRSTTTRRRRPAPAAAGEPASRATGPPAAPIIAARAPAYETAMRALFAAHPTTSRSAAFYALALLGTAPPTDKTLANQKRAAADPRAASTQTNPDHPGVVHYLIHAYDYPPLAAQGPPGGAGPTRGSRRGCRTRCTCRRTSSRGSGMWNGRDRLEPGLGRRRAPVRRRAPPRRDVVRGAARARLPGLRLPADGGDDARREACSRGSRRCARPSRPPTSRPPTRSARCPRATRSSGGSGPRPPRSSSRRLGVAGEVSRSAPRTSPSRARSAPRARAACRKRARRWRSSSSWRRA